MVSSIPRLGRISAVLRKVSRRPSSVANSNISELFHALARLPDYKNNVPVYFKIYDPEIERKAFFNEIIGYQTARLFGLPVPGDVRVCACRHDLVPAHSHARSLRSSEEAPYLPGLASVDANPKGVIQISGQGVSPILLNELRSWKFLTKVAALDELLLNVDRHYKNLHRIGAHKFILIDHERILDGYQWTTEVLTEKMNRASTANHIASFVTEATDAETQNRMIQMGVDYAQSLEITEQSLNIECAQLDSFCQLKPGTTKYVLELINARLDKLAEFLFYHVKAGQLFQ